MSLKLDKFLIILSAFALILANTVSGFAENELQTIELDINSVSENGDFEQKKPDVDSKNNDLKLQNPNFEAENSTDSGPDSFSSGFNEQTEFLNRLKQELNLSKTDYRQVLNNISDAKTRLNLVTEQKFSLQEQLANLDAVSNKTTEKLINVIKNIVETENGVTVLSNDMETKKIALNYHKNLLSDYIRVIYQEEKKYFSIDENGEIDAFKMLLADSSVGANLKELKYFDLLNETGQIMITELINLTDELQKNEKELNKNKEKLQTLQKKLEIEKSQLSLQKQSKENLLKLTQGQEEVFSQLLEQTEKEQEQLLNDIKNLGNAVGFIEKKIAEQGENFNPEQFRSLLDYRMQAIYDFQLGAHEFNGNGFLWPVDPDLGISAYFREPSYIGTFGVQHNGVDIPEYQGSPVRAAADGVVYSSRDNGYGYNYVILVHAGGFMSVYGHLGSILVAEGDTIAQGSIIGLSGGMPGTKGAGYMTSGPHLHFEVLLNGFYVDPLNYLPLEFLTEEFIDKLPEKYKDDWEAAVEKVEYKPIER